MPTSVAKLRKRYDETKDRHDPNLKQFLSGRGYEGEDVDRILLSRLQNNETTEVEQQIVVGMLPLLVLPLTTNIGDVTVEDGIV